MRNLRNSKGFTLIELMIVVVIIGILAAIAIPKFTKVADGAKQAEAEPILAQICTLAQAAYLKDNTWPAAIDSIAGWADPDAEHFDSFTFTQATHTASAATSETGLQDADMDCETKDITLK